MHLYTYATTRRYARCSSADMYQVYRNKAGFASRVFAKPINNYYRYQVLIFIPGRIILIIPSCTAVCVCSSYHINPFRTAVPFWGQSTWNLSGMSQQRDCGSKRVKPSCFYPPTSRTTSARADSSTQQYLCARSSSLIISHNSVSRNNGIASRRGTAVPSRRRYESFGCRPVRLRRHSKLADYTTARKIKAAWHQLRSFHAASALSGWVVSPAMPLFFLYFGEKLCYLQFFFVSFGSVVKKRPSHNSLFLMSFGGKSCTR